MIKSDSPDEGTQSRDVRSVATTLPFSRARSSAPQVRLELHPDHDVECPMLEMGKEAGQRSRGGYGRDIEDSKCRRVVSDTKTALSSQLSLLVRLNLYCERIELTELPGSSHSLARSGIRYSEQPTTSVHL